MKFADTNIVDISNACASTSVINNSTIFNPDKSNHWKLNDGKTDHALLLKKMSQVTPELSFDHVLTRGGWHRTGGLINSDGDHICENLREWLETESNGDVNELIDKYLDAGLIVTRMHGKTHYFTAQTGVAAQEFVQLEVEEVQEVQDHYLLNCDSLPDDIEEVIDPIDINSIDTVLEEKVKLHEIPVAEPRYIFRRITRVNDFLQTMSERMMTRGNKYNSIQRFMQDWERSSSKDAGPFSHHWVLSMQEYTDAYGEPIMQAKPVSTYNGKLSLMKLNGVHRGSKLARLIHGFDHDIGYPMAWYFFMLSHSEVPHQLAEAIHKDLMGAYDYLPARDLKVLKDWSANPYGI